MKMPIPSRIALVGCFIFTGVMTTRWLIATQPYAWRWVLVPLVCISLWESLGHLFEMATLGEKAREEMVNKMVATHL